MHDSRCHYDMTEKQITEKQITEKIIKALKQHGYWVLKVHGGPMQKSGIPDILACRNGRLLAIEVKRPGGRVTAIQRKRLAELEAAGADVVVITSVDEALSIMRNCDGPANQCTRMEVRT